MVENNNPNELNTTSSIKQNIFSKYLIIFIVAVLFFVVGYLSHYFILIKGNLKDGESTNQLNNPPKVLQIDVLNGCGVQGVGARFTNYLRSKGFDVVEMKNYKNDKVENTIVIDRIGNLELARQVATTLGVSEKNIIQQINPDYFVDVTVVIGKDYLNLISNK